MIRIKFKTRHSNDDWFAWMKSLRTEYDLENTRYDKISRGVMTGNGYSYNDIKIPPFTLRSTYPEIINNLSDKLASDMGIVAVSSMNTRIGREKLPLGRYFRSTKGNAKPLDDHDAEILIWSDGNDRVMINVSVEEGIHSLAIFLDVWSDLISGKLDIGDEDCVWFSPD